MAHSNSNDASNSEPADPPAVVDAVHEPEQEQEHDHHYVESVFAINVKLPHDPFEAKIQVSSEEQVQDIRQSIVDQPFAMQYSNFHLEHNGERVNDFVELSEVPDVGPESTFTLVEDPYTEKEARMHVIRVRELIGASGDRTDLMHGLLAGVSLHDNIMTAHMSEGQGNGHVQTGKPGEVGDLSEHQFDAAGAIKTLLPSYERAPKTVKSISLSPWNPPPYHLRTRGHLLYLIVVNLEGEQFHITSHVSGFYVNRSSHNKFDPSPKPGPKTSTAHSLLTLLHQIDSRFSPAFADLLTHNSKREPLAMFQLTNAIPASPWVVSPESVNLLEHQLDITRSQESFLIAGTEATENLRDWNEEFQSTRELPTDTIPDKVFRERLTSKLFADYSEAAARGAILVARGEVAPLNPTEDRWAQIFVHNNVFFSFGADGVGTFATEGGDEAARVATGKDVAGVRAVNQLDIPGLFTTGTVIVDYLGKRIVGQSIVPGIFRQREPGEPQIDYGGVEGKDVIAEKEEFVKPFETLSKAMHIRKHPVWDKEGKRHELEASVDTKGLLGTDGRKYVLDLYRVTPLDVTWLEKYWSEPGEGEKSEEKDYPHRMAVLRSELIEAYRMLKLREYVDSQVAKKMVEIDNSKKSNAAAINGHTEKSQDSISDLKESEPAKASGSLDTEIPDADTEAQAVAESESKAELTRAIYADFSFSLNPDVFAGQVPQTEEEREQMEKDEADVRAVCEYLSGQVIPRLIEQLQEGEVGFPMDGNSFSTLLHKRGINMRYLGVIATQASKEHPRVQALRRLAVQEMVSRAFKHVASKYLRALPGPLAPACVSHMLNCLLGSRITPEPAAETDEFLKSLYGDADLAYEGLTAKSLRKELVYQIRLRYRYVIEGDLVGNGKELQMLREVSLKLGLQLLGRDYIFAKDQLAEIEAGEVPPMTHHLTNGSGKKKKKSNNSSSPPRGVSPLPKHMNLTFHPDDVVNFVPVVKEASPKSTLAEEAFEGGRLSMAQDQKEIGQELLLESLALYEQIYGILHPEVARHYLQLSSIYYNLDDKATAAELARKAVVIAERTLGLDAAETILAYLNLGLFEHACGKSSLALRYLLHATDLTKIIYGQEHPDSVTTINNAAVMLQAMKRYHESRIWFEASLALSENSANPLGSATLLFQLAQALALDKDHRAAVNKMRESCSLFRNILGPDDRNTKEAESWLDQLTLSAVTQAKRAKDLASGKLRRVQFPLGTRSLPLPNTGAGNADPTGAVRTAKQNGSADPRNIDDLIKYIDGEDAKKKKAAANLSNGDRKKTSNPKRRGGMTVGSRG